jgi:hypothetical protein
MLHQGTVCSATAPFIKIVAGLVTDPRTAAPVADILPWDPEPRPLRVALLDYLALFAQACRFNVPGKDLIRDAYPAGRDEADLQRIYRAARDCDWRLDPDPARKPLSPPWWKLWRTRSTARRCGPGPCSPAGRSSPMSSRRYSL